MKKLYLLFSIFLSSKCAYNQVNVLVVEHADKRYAFINKTTKQQVSNLTWIETEPFVNGFAKVATEKKWGFVDKNGIPVANSFYTDVRNFVKNLAAANNNNKWGFINEQAKIIIPFEYDIVYDFTEEVTAGYKNNKWFLINKSAAILKPLDVDVFFGFKNGKARIMKYGRNGFINVKGDIISLDAAAPPSAINFTAKSNSATSEPCPENIGFENGNFTNWLCDTGIVAGVGTTNVITLFPSTPIANRHVIIPSANPSALDAYGLFSTNPPDGSNFALKLGNNVNGKQAERVSYQITVPAGSTDASITYRYAVVFEDPGHLNHEQPRFIAKLLDVSTNTYLPCASYEYIADAALPGFFDSPIDSSVKCKSWASVFVNLSAYAGKTMRLEFTTADCTRGLHWGYAYVDVGDCNIAADVNYTCNPSTANLVAPAGFQFYNWWNSNYTAIVATGQNATISPIPANNTVLHVEVIPYNGFGCKDTLQVLINNNATIANAGADKFICLLATTTIGSIAVTGNSYSWSPTIGLSNANISNPTASPVVTTMYYLTVSNGSSACPGTDSVLVTVYPKPIPAFITTAAQCIFNNNFSFTNNSTGGATYLWYFGDGTTSTATNPTKNYTTANTYTVKLVVTSTNGCKDSISRTINVFPKPTAEFTAPAPQCIFNNNFSFANTSTGSATYLWYFGDGTTSAVTNPTKIYATANTYTVKLVVTSANGCKDSLSRIIIVYPKPTAAFTTPASQCIFNNNFSYVNSSIGAVSYLWYFGDGTTSTATNPTKNYTTANTYTVKLVVTSANGCKDSLSRIISVYPKPTAAFTTPASQCIFNNNFSFVNNSIGGVSYLWYLGDGTTSTATNPTKIYASAITYTVKLVVTSAKGCKDSLSRTISVYPKPAAAFIAPVPQCIFNNNFSFTNNSAGGTTFLWYFGDGTTSTATNPTKIYASANTYTVKLVVTSANGCKDSLSRIVVVYPKPTAAFIAPASQCIFNNTFSFANTSTGSTTYLWYFGDGTTSTVQNPTHSYLYANTFTVKLIVTNSNGCKDSLSRIVIVYPKPIPSFTTATPQCFSTNNFTFTNTSTGSATYLWYFGDGTTSTSINPTHSYASANTYTVKLIVTSINGCKDSIVSVINVFANPVATFISPASQCFANNNFSFVNNSIGAASYLWNFGDGSTSTAQSPTHSYNSANAFTVKLVVTNSNGCKDSMTSIVNVYAKPIPAFATPSPQCFSNNNFTFNNNSVGASTYFWNFGDGNTSTAQVPTHSYAIAGNYTTKLLVTNNFGCADSISNVTNVLAVPTPAFIAPAAQCILNNNFLFTNTSTGATTYLWNFGDGFSSTLPNPTHSYNVANTYTVKLIVTNGNGCWDTISNVLQVNTGATLIIGNDAAVCKGRSTPLSILGAQSYQWTPSLGLSCDTCASPIATPAITTTYTVTGLSNGSCPSSDTVKVTVFQPIDMNVSPNKKICTNETFKLYASGASTYLWSPSQGLNSTTSANPTTSTTSTIQYMVIGFDNNNCFKDTGYVKITVLPKPTIQLAADQTVSTGTVVPLSAITTNGPIVSWLWTPATNLSCTNCSQPMATIKKDITYTATVKNIYGCIASDDISFHSICEGSQVYVPNAFTPDGDGKNDILMVRSKGIEAIRSFKIYSRWGELIFEKYNFPPNDPTYGWDGKIKAIAGSAEVYVYVAQVTCDNIKDFIIKGNITILK